MTEPDCGRPDESVSGASQRLSPERVREIYDLWSGDVRAFLWGLTRSHEQTDDLLQITFSRLVEAGHTAREESLRGWLFRVAYNETMLWRRRTGVQTRGIRKVAAESADNTGTPAWTSLVRREEVERVQQALQQLPPEQKLVVEQRIYQERTFAQIAEEHGLPLGTVLTRMRLALAKLQQRLTDNPLLPRKITKPPLEH